MNTGKLLTSAEQDQRGRRFASGFVQAGGDGHPASLYLIKIFEDGLRLAQHTSSIMNAPEIARGLEEMHQRSKMLTPAELVEGYTRETLAGKLPIFQKKIPPLEQSMLQYGWNGQPLVIHGLSQLPGSRKALNSGSHRLQAVANLLEANLLPSGFRIPLFDLGENWSWYYASHLKGLSTEKHCKNPSVLSWQTLCEWWCHSDFFKVTTGISGLQLEPAVMQLFPSKRHDPIGFAMRAYGPRVRASDRKSPNKTA